jgi:glucoselysine-6-phosphate deglycase
MNDNTMWDYIEEQPTVLRSILNKHQHTTFIDNITKPTTIIITASGTSLNAAYTLKPFFNQILDCTIIIENPFQLRYYHSLLKKKHENTILIGISQTGKSTGTIDCLKLANAQNIPTIALTEASDSPLANIANHVVPIGCGEENAPPKTKGFSATVLTLQLLVIDLLHKQDNSLLQEYSSCIKDMSSTILDAKVWAKNHSYWAKAPTITTVGFGYNDGIAKEGALKLLETMQIPVMNYDLEEFMHGPHRTIVKDSYIILIQTYGLGSIFMDRLIDFVKTKTDNYLVISSCHPSDDHTISIKDSPLSSTWMQSVIPFQVLACYFPELNGVNPTKPVYASFATSVGTRIL